jgi:hypothetical protein
LPLLDGRASDFFLIRVEDDDDGLVPLSLDIVFTVCRLSSFSEIVDKRRPKVRSGVSSAVEVSGSHQS